MEPGEVTRLLRAYEAGDAGAFNRLVPLVYEELRRIARGQIRRAPAWPSLDSAGLVHEAYLKLVAAEDLSLADRGHLMAVAASAMRQVLIDRARARLRAKRGGGQPPEELDEHPAIAPSPESLLDLDRALGVLRERDERLVRVFECRFFAGMSEDETAKALGVSLRTVQRDWMRARAWLRSELEAAPPRADGA
ncbi:MAG TPA: ECF-type sigma factor [Vicinamibacteria bacterium]|nr:ECF-type sigma factor [Vicinamibacteria bacterium]